MADKNRYHLQDDTKHGGVFDLTDTEAEQMRAKGWIVVPEELVDPARSGHLHLLDENGKFVGSRVLDAIQAADFVRQGYHLVHVGDATSRELEDLRNHGTSR